MVENLHFFDARRERIIASIELYYGLKFSIRAAFSIEAQVLRRRCLSLCAASHSSSEARKSEHGAN